MAARTIRVNLSADATNFTQNIRNASRSVSSLGSELNANVKRIRTETKLLQESLGNTATDVQKVGLSFQGLSRVLQQQSQYTRRVQTDLDALRTTSNATSIEVRKLEQRLLSAALAEQTTANALGRLKNELAGLRSTDSLQKISHAMDLAAVASQKMVASLGPAASGTSLYQAKITGLNKELQISIRLQRELAAAFTRSATTYKLTNDKTKAIRLQMSQASLATQNLRNNIKQLQGQMAMVSANDELQRTSFLMRSASIDSQKMTANLRSGASAIDRNRAALEGLNRERSASQAYERALQGSVVSASAQYGDNSQESRGLQLQLLGQGLATSLLDNRITETQKAIAQGPRLERLARLDTADVFSSARTRVGVARLGADPSSYAQLREQLKGINREYSTAVARAEELRQVALSSGMAARQTPIVGRREQFLDEFRVDNAEYAQAKARMLELKNARKSLRDATSVAKYTNAAQPYLTELESAKFATEELTAGFRHNTSAMSRNLQTLPSLRNQLRYAEEAYRVMGDVVDSANMRFGAADSRSMTLAGQHRQLGIETLRLRTRIDDLAESTSRYTRIASVMSSPALLTAGIGMSTALSYPSYRVIRQGMLYNSVIENNTVAFKTMFASLEKAHNMIENVQSFAVVTPFRTSEIADQVRALTQFGVAAENALPIAKLLGDISLGDPTKFGILAYNYAQATSLGRLQARDAYSMNLAGFNPKTAIEAYRESQGKPKGNIDKEMEEGAVSIVELTQAMIYATSAGQKFHDGMLNASKTVSGQLSTLRDNIDITLGAMTRSLYEYTRTKLLPALIAITSWITKFSEVNPKTAQFIITFTLIGAAIGPVLIGVYALGQAITYMNAGWAVLRGMGLITVFRNMRLGLVALQASAAAAGTTVAGAGLAAAGAWLLAAAKVVAIIAAVAVLAYTTRLVIANWETTKDYFNALRIFMGSTFGVIGNYIVKAFYDGQVVAGNFFDYVRSAAENMAQGKFTGWEVDESLFTVQARANAAFAKDDIATSIDNLYKASGNMTNAYEKMAKGMGDTMVKDWEYIKNSLPDFSFDVEPPKLDVPLPDLSKIVNGTKAGEDALEKLKNKIESLVDKIRDQAKAFRDALGLFDKAVTEKISGEKLMLRLRSQFKIFESWSASIATLKARLGASSPLFQELLSKGPSAAGQVKAIAKMNDLQLGMYNNMYQDKGDIALGAGGLLVGLQAQEESKLEKIKQVIININGGVVVGNEAQLVDTVTKELKRQGVF